MDKWVYIGVGIFLILSFVASYSTYMDTECLESIVAPTVCGDSAKLVLGGYLIGALGGIYMIYTGVVKYLRSRDHK